jgi:hypothetical protein
MMKSGEVGKRGGGKVNNTEGGVEILRCAQDDNCAQEAVLSFPASPLSRFPAGRIPHA